MFVVTHYDLDFNNLPSEFDGIKIAQISDVHNVSYGKNNSALINKIKKEHPDLIAITGDLIDAFHPNFDLTKNFIEQLVNIAPCYYVQGNHERHLGKKFNIYDKLEKWGCHTLRNSATNIYINDLKPEQTFSENSFIHLIGIADLDVTSKSRHNLSETLNTISDNEHFQLLLIHKPYFLSSFTPQNIDLVLAGHTHGGQLIIPFIGGLYATNAGFFPKYDFGEFNENNTTMIVSRGLIKNAGIFLRINNRPELNIITLHKS